MDAMLCFWSFAGNSQVDGVPKFSSQEYRRRTCGCLWYARPCYKGSYRQAHSCRSVFRVQATRRILVPNTWSQNYIRKFTDLFTEIGENNDLVSFTSTWGQVQYSCISATVNKKKYFILTSRKKWTAKVNANNLKLFSFYDIMFMLFVLLIISRAVDDTPDRVDEGNSLCSYSLWYIFWN